MMIKTVRQFLNSLRAGPFTSIGCYPVYWVASDGQVLSYEACRENVWLIARAIRDRDDTGGWRVIGSDINWEDSELYCAHTGERIESAYAEDEVSK